MLRSPRSSGLMSTGDGHQIYYELNGNPRGIPVLVLHGGPGAGLSSAYADFFDQDSYLVIGFEQRGCGRSKPQLELANNTTRYLLDDIRQLRNLLGIEKWLLFGGSWGTTLALMAAIDSPESVSAMILRGIFLARQEDFQWFLAPDGGAAQIYPDAYQRFTQDIENPVNLTSVLNHYQQSLTHSSVQQREIAALRWYQWEETIARVYPPHSVQTPPQSNPLIISLALMEWHYVSHQCFMAENEILANASRLRGIPGTLIHGRCDTVCKPEGAFLLHQHWPGSTLQFIEGAGHSSAEYGISSALREATDFYKTQL